MIQLTYDGTFAGLLTVIFDIYQKRIHDFTIVKKSEAIALSTFENIFVNTDDEKTKRVWKGLSMKLSNLALRNIYWCYLSELHGIENTIYHFAHHVFSHGKSIETDYGNAHVLDISQTGRKVGREKHRFEAFIRFELVSPDLYYAPIDPDFNVLPIILPHFKRRYADQNWIIYDTKRRYGMHYDKALEEINEIAIDFNIKESSDTQILFDYENEKYERLWRSYFKSANIPARKNMKLHLRHIPKRYWKYLTEKKVDV